jgi:hypothetical protein
VKRGLRVTTSVQLGTPSPRVCGPGVPILPIAVERDLLPLVEDKGGASRALSVGSFGTGIPVLGERTAFARELPPKDLVTISVFNLFPPRQWFTVWSKHAPASEISA